MDAFLTQVSFQAQSESLTLIVAFRNHLIHLKKCRNSTLCWVKIRANKGADLVKSALNQGVSWKRCLKVMFQSIKEVTIVGWIVLSKGIKRNHNRDEGQTYRSTKRNASIQIRSKASLRKNGCPHEISKSQSNDCTRVDKSQLRKRLKLSHSNWMRRQLRNQKRNVTNLLKPAHSTSISKKVRKIFKSDSKSARTSQKTYSGRIKRETRIRQGSWPNRTHPSSKRLRNICGRSLTRSSAISITEAKATSQAQRASRVPSYSPSQLGSPTQLRERLLLYRIRGRVCSKRVSTCPRSYCRALSLNLQESLKW